MPFQSPLWFALHLKVARTQRETAQMSQVSLSTPILDKRTLPSREEREMQYKYEYVKGEETEAEALSQAHQARPGIFKLIDSALCTLATNSAITACLAYQRVRPLLAIPPREDIVGLTGVHLIQWKIPGKRRTRFDEV